MTAGLSDSKNGECTLIPILFFMKMVSNSYSHRFSSANILCAQWISWFKILSCMTNSDHQNTLNPASGIHGVFHFTLLMWSGTNVPHEVLREDSRQQDVSSCKRLMKTDGSFWRNLSGIERPLVLFLVFNLMCCVSTLLHSKNISYV